MLSMQSNQTKTILKNIMKCFHDSQIKTAIKKIMEVNKLFEDGTEVFGKKSETKISTSLAL